MSDISDIGTKRVNDTDCKTRRTSQEHLYWTEIAGSKNPPINLLRKNHIKNKKIIWPSFIVKKKTWSIKIDQ